MIDIFYEAWAIAKRDLKKENKILNYVIFFISIVPIILLIGYGFDSFIDFSKYGASYTEFFTSGIVAYLIAVGAIHTGADLILDRKGFTRILLVAPVSRFSILLGKTISALVGFFKAYFVLIIFLLIWFSKFDFIKLIFISLYIIYVTLIFLSVGIWLSSLFERKQTMDTILSFLPFVLLIISGVLFPISATPAIVQKVFYLNPLTYFTDLLRLLMTGESYYPLILNIIFASAFGIVSMILGTIAYDKNLRK